MYFILVLIPAVVVSCCNGVITSTTGAVVYLENVTLGACADSKQFVCLEVQLCLCVRCTKIINADSEDPKYIINVKQFAKFVVDLSDQVAPTDIEEGMRVG